MHNYYAQPIYYTDVSKLCECLTDSSIPLSKRLNIFFHIYAPTAVPRTYKKYIFAHEGAVWSRYSED